MHLALNPVCKKSGGGYSRTEPLQGEGPKVPTPLTQFLWERKMKNLHFMLEIATVNVVHLIYKNGNVLHINWISYWKWFRLVIIFLNWKCIRAYIKFSSWAQYLVIRVPFSGTFGRCNVILYSQTFASRLADEYAWPLNNTKHLLLHSLLYLRVSGAAAWNPSAKIFENSWAWTDSRPGVLC